MFCNSPVPTTASTSGIRLRISSRKRSTRQPATTSFFARPEVLCAAISRIVLTDSCCALSMNEQVFTTMTSASSARVESSAPARARSPIITSLSTRFFGHPRLTKPTFVAGATRVLFSAPEAIMFSLESGIVRFFECMESSYFNIFYRWASVSPKPASHGTSGTTEDSSLRIKSVHFMLG
jgi:hypothetical protein